MRRDVRILLVGDGKPCLPRAIFPFHNLGTVFPEGVGKSTIVTSLIKEAFVAHVGGHEYVFLIAI